MSLASHLKCKETRTYKNKRQRLYISIRLIGCDICRYTNKKIESYTVGIFLVLKKLNSRMGIGWRNKKKEKLRQKRGKLGDVPLRKETREECSFATN